MRHHRVIDNSRDLAPESSDFARVQPRSIAAVGSNPYTSDVTHGPPQPVVPDGWPADDALPVHGWETVDVPLADVWAAFGDVDSWSRWNPCITAARIRDGELRVGATLQWIFAPIKGWYPYRLPAVATITEVVPNVRVTWEVSLPGFHAFHTYLFAPSEVDGRSQFGSWEIARGPMYRLLRPFWLAHFRFVRDASIAGATSLSDRRVRTVAHGPEPTAQQPPIVVIPGIDGQPGSVQPIVDRLARKRRVLLVDYSREIESSLRDVADAIGDLLPDRFDLVGQSIGTWIAAEVAQRRPDAVRRVVLVAPFTRVRRVATRLSATLTRVTPTWLYRRTTPTLMAIVCGPVGDGKAHPFLDGVAESNQAGVARRTRWQVDRDASDLLGGIEQPVAAFLGRDDRFIPRRRAEFERIASIFSRPSDRVAFIDNAGQVMLPSAAIDRVAAGIEDFLA